jgi:ribosome maturation factor RimP
MRSLTPFEAKMLALIDPIAAGLGFEIVRVRMRGAKRKTLEIRAERSSDGAMDAGDCAQLDLVDPIAEAYDLEVSSPGIDRPLTRVKDFDRWRGFEARIELDRMVEGRKRFRGVLAGIEEDAVLIDLEGDDQTAVIPFDWIADARLTLSDELISESLRRAAASGDAADGMGLDALDPEIVAQAAAKEKKAAGAGKKKSPGAGRNRPAQSAPPHAPRKDRQEH